MNLNPQPAVITLADYLGEHVKTHSEEITSQLTANATRTVNLVNQLFQALEMGDVKVERNARGSFLNSGWRPATYNAGVAGAATRSLHITGEAADIFDPDGAIDDYLMGRLMVLGGLGLYMEHPASTKGWCHVQTRPPRSGNRVFYP